jgi:hypothetical protein
MTRRNLLLAAGVVVGAIGAYLVVRPEVVRAALGRHPATTSDWINLRATFGGTLVGLGAFLAWWPAPRPWSRTVIGLLMWAMAGIGLARAIGFALDGSPDTRQYIWIVAEAAIVVIGAALLLRRRSP